MKRVCAWCNKLLGYKPGEGTTHGICDDCAAKTIQEFEKENKGEQHEPIQ